jgi:hypothetical protein
VRTSSIHVADIDAAPMLGMTAIGFPEDGITTNHGRVGLCQNGVKKPVKYRTSGSVQIRMAPMSWDCISC